MNRELKYLRDYITRQKLQSARRVVDRQDPGTAGAQETPTIVRHRIPCYLGEMEMVSKWILDYPDRETGGQIYGFRDDAGTPVPLYFTGPGPDADHDVACYYQDISYLHKLDNVIRRTYGLVHIGEWHSHHRLPLFCPSSGDVSTMNSGMEVNGRDKMLLCIGNYHPSDKTTTLNAYLFVRGGGYEKVDWRILNRASPLRHTLDKELEGVVLLPRTSSSNMRIPKASSGQFVAGYWLEKPENRKIMKEMVDGIAARTGCTPKIVKDDSGLAHIITDFGSVVDDIVFPSGFPKRPPRMSRSGEPCRFDWDYNGDILNTFLRCYDVRKQDNVPLYQ